MSRHADIETLRQCRVGRADKDFYLLNVTKKQVNETKWQMISHGKPKERHILQMQLAG